MTAPGTCICGRPLPVRPRYQTPATHCSWWCAQVTRGIYTLEQIQPMLGRDRGPIPNPPEPNLFDGGAA